MMTLMTPTIPFDLLTAFVSSEREVLTTLLFTATEHKTFFENLYMTPKNMEAENWYDQQAGRP